MASRGIRGSRLAGIGVLALLVLGLLSVGSSSAAGTIPKGLFPVGKGHAQTAADKAAPELVPNGCIGGGNPECNLSSREVLPCQSREGPQGSYWCTVVAEDHRETGCELEFQLIKVAKLQPKSTRFVPPNNSSTTIKVKVEGKWRLISVELFAPWHAPPGFDTEAPCRT